MPHNARVAPVMANEDPESQRDTAVVDSNNQTPSASQQRSARRRKLRRILNKLLVILGFLFIIGCFVMASFAYIFLEDCRGCSDDAPELYMAKVFRFLSAALFLVGVFMVAFSVCNYREGGSIAQYGDSENLRRISLETVACVLTGAALEKSPSRLLSSCTSNSASNPLSNTTVLTCPITELINNKRPTTTSGINAGETSNSERTATSTQKQNQRGLFRRYSFGFPLRTIDEDISNPPPSYEQALTMMNENSTDTERTT